uniref:RNA-directed DNA polymerase n=1 Tax=Strigamia maritima TaxID=126957 RepID=T1J180_STRMM
MGPWGFLSFPQSRSRNTDKQIRTHIPYVTYELRFRELSLKVLYVFGNHETLSSLDWDEKLVAGSDCTPAQRLLLKDVLTSVSGVFSENPGCSLTHEHGLGAILCQDENVWNEKKQEFIPTPKAVAFASRVLREAEVRYSTPELQCLAVVWVIERFKPYIEYTTFILESDAQALKWLMSTPEPSGRFGSGLYESRVRRRLNWVADAFSRAPLPTEEIPADDYLEMKEPTRYWPDWNGNELSLKLIKSKNDPVDLSSKEEIKSTELSGEGEDDTDEGQKVTLYSALTDLLNEVPPTRVDIIAEQRKDPFCILITEYLMMDDEQKKKKNKKISKEFKEKAKGFLLDSHMTDVNIKANVPDTYCMIVKFRPTFQEELNDSVAGFKAYIPPTLIHRVIFACYGHPLSGHAGISKTLHRAQQLYYWPKMSKDIKRYVLGCLHCQQYKPPHKRPHVPHNMAYQWETICVDLCRPKPTAQGLKKWNLVIVDQCTKYVELFPLATASSTTIVKKINEVACHWGHPSKIISDNGSQFVSTIFCDFCE